MPVGTKKESQHQNHRESYLLLPVTYQTPMIKTKPTKKINWGILLGNWVTNQYGAKAKSTGRRKYECYN
jgi:hypothetical protein